MMNFLTETAAQGGGGGIMIMVMYIVVIGAMMYFIAIRPQRKEQKRMSALLASVEVGDVIVTTSGFYGVVMAMEEADVIVECGHNKT